MILLHLVVYLNTQSPLRNLLTAKHSGNETTVLVLRDREERVTKCLAEGYPLLSKFGRKSGSG